MKKTFLAIGIIAVLGGGYVGAEWYTGKVIENQINDKINEITQKANANQNKFNIAITYNDYHKSVFSTKLHLTVTISPKGTTNQKVKPLKIFNDNLTIHHGPFPLGALSNGAFMPQMAWLEYQMNEQTSPELWKLAGNQPLLTGSMGISYQNDFRIKVNSKGFTLDETKLQELLKLYQNMYTTYFDPDLDHSDELDSVFNNVTGKITVSDSEMYFETDPDFSNLTIKNHLSNLSYQKDNDNYALLKELNIEAKCKNYQTNFDIKLNFDKLAYSNIFPNSFMKLDIDKYHSQGNFNIVKSNMTIESGFDSFQLTPNSDDPQETLPAIKLNKLVWNQKNLINSNDRYDGDLVASIDSLTIGKQNFGSGAIDIAYQNINKKLATYDANKFMRHLTEDEPKKVDNITVTINKLNWHNAQGDINVNGLFDFIPPEKSFSSKFGLENINTFKIKVAVPFNVIAQTMAQFKNLQDNDVKPDQLQQLKETLKSQSMVIFQGSPLINYSQDDIEGIFSEVDLSKDRDDIKVNGKSLKKEDLLGKKDPRGGNNNIEVDLH